MPHILIEHNGDADMDIADLTSAIHAEAMTIDALPVGGLRTRAYAASEAQVGDADPNNRFVYITIRLGHGRDEATRKDIGDRLFQVLTEWAEGRFSRNEPTSLGLEVQEIAPGSTWKKNNIHDILKAKTNG